MVNHIYTVEFTILGPQLQPDLITQELGLQPCQIRTRVQRFPGRNEESLWAYNGTDSSSLEWETLEEGLDFVLTRLWPHLPVIERYRIWWCGHFQSSFDGGPQLSANILRRLADFGTDVFIDTHFCEANHL